MDLHAWITRQVDRAEDSARAQLKGHRVAFESHDDNGPAFTGTITGVTQTPEGLQLDVAQYGAEPVADAWTNVPSVAAVLRRCEADRRILDRHRVDPTKASWPEATACEGCGIDTSWGLPNIDNLNDCPELLDLAHAHGATEAELAGLDRPQPPERKPPGISFIQMLQQLLNPGTPIADVPPALRGPRWKPDTA